LPRSLSLSSISTQCWCCALINYVIRRGCDWGYGVSLLCTYIRQTFTVMLALSNQIWDRVLLFNLILLKLRLYLCPCPCFIVWSS
jgi:hypothetical protein